jgi:1-aminocyclopropane-1-carboxylate deaminase/D-cysteine desulfhydrase-like pyridoxal-dependent ACC family enzyme
LPSHETLAALLDEQASDYQHLYVSCGTGATFLALAAGLSQRQLNHIRLHGISVEKKPENITTLASQALALHGNSLIYPSPSGRHFGQLTPEMLAISKACFEQKGIAPDPIYDALVLLQIYQNQQKGLHQAHEEILWLHSGGLTGWAGYPSKCHELFGL